MVPEIKRIAGVGDVLLFGSPYAMRVWLNPDLLTKYKLTVNDVANAIREQNQNYAVGEIGTAPNATGQVLTFPVQTGGTFTDPEQFANIIVRAAADGSVVRVRDVARVELGADDYQISMRLNGKPATGIGVYLRPGGNALETADQVRAKMQQLSASMPSDIEWRAPYDTTVFVKASIELVVHTFIEAFVLVLIVVYLFLGSVRATIIPMLAIPVSLVGTAAGMLLMGFSINMLTLFGLVLAIGIVVDDAIVVVEAVEKIMHDKGLGPREASREAMKGIGGAIIGVTAVICAVFVPIAFLGGVTGTLYKQFAITITISTLLSAITALTLTPALCALILKQGMHKPKPIQAFDRFFDKVTGGVRRRRRRDDPALRPLHRSSTRRSSRACPTCSRRSPAASSPRRTRARCSSSSTCPPAPRPSASWRCWTRSRRCCARSPRSATPSASSASPSSTAMRTRASSTSRSRTGTNARPPTSTCWR